MTTFGVTIHLHASGSSIITLSARKVAFLGVHMPYVTFQVGFIGCSIRARIACKRLVSRMVPFMSFQV